MYIYSDPILCVDDLFQCMIIKRVGVFTQIWENAFTELYLVIRRREKKLFDFNDGLILRHGH